MCTWSLQRTRVLPVSCVRVAKSRPDVATTASEAKGPHEVRIWRAESTLTPRNLFPLMLTSSSPTDRTPSLKIQISFSISNSINQMFLLFLLDVLCEWTKKNQIENDQINQLKSFLPLVLSLNWFLYCRCPYSEQTIIVCN